MSMDQQPSSWHFHADKPNGKKRKVSARTVSQNTTFRKSTASSAKQQRISTESSAFRKTAAPHRSAVATAVRRKSIPLPKIAAAVACVAVIGCGIWFAKEHIPNLLSSVGRQQSSLSGDNTVLKDIGGTCVIRSGEEKLPQAIQQALKTWFVTTFNATAQFKAPNLSDLYSTDSEGTLSRLLDETALDYIGTVRSMQAVDLSLTGFEIGLTILDCTSDGNGNYVVTLMEDDQVQFACLGGRTSSSCDIFHQFTFTDDGLILYHEKTEDGFTLIRELYQEQMSDSPEDTLRQIRDMLVSTAQFNITELNNQRSRYPSDADYIASIAPTAAQPYNREAAVAYARQWVGTTSVVRNTEWGVYDVYGGNCNNFASQCLYAGGIPMDIYGYDFQQWKWYDETLNENSDASGRSSSWSGVDEFYAYVQQNTGYGLVAQTDINIYAAQPGDVIQYEADGEWKHSVLVTEVLTDDNGQPLDLLIASNTTDRIDWPMSAYSYTNVRLIHVLGYNT